MGYFNGELLESEGTFYSRLFVQLVIILVLPRILHFTLLQHFKQPRVVSEIVSGIVLGPSCLGQVADFTDLFFPTRSISYLSSLAAVGVVLLLFKTGLHLDLPLIWKNRWFTLAACVVPTGISFALAVGLAKAFTDEKYMKLDETQCMIIIAVMLSIPAEAVMARILAERGLLRTRMGSVLMSLSTIGVATCFILVAAVLSLYSHDHPWSPPPVTCPGTVYVTPFDGDSLLDPLWVVLCFFGFVLGCVTFIRFFCSALVTRTERKGRMESIVFVASLVVCFAVTWVTQTLGLSDLLGPLCVGLLSFSRRGPLCQSLETALGPVTVMLLVPIFFTLVGLKTNWTLLTADDVMLAFLLLGSLWISAFVGGFLVALVFLRRRFWASFYFAVLLTCKGLTALTIANILKSVGVITDRFYGVLVLFAVLSCVLVSPIIVIGQLFEARWKAKHKKSAAPPPPELDVLGGEAPRTLVVPRDGYLAAVAATLAAWLANISDKSATLFARFIDDIEDIDQYIPLLAEPIPPALLISQDVLGPASVCWRCHRPSGAVSYRLIVAPSLDSAFAKLCHGGSKLTDHRPFSVVIVGYDQTSESRHIIDAAIASGTAHVSVVTGRPGVALARTRVGLVVPGESGDPLSGELFARQDAVSVLHWRESTADVDNLSLPELGGARTLLDLLHNVAELDKPPTFEAIFVAAPPSRALNWNVIDAAHQCPVPVVFDVPSRDGDRSMSKPMCHIDVSASVPVALGRKDDDDDDDDEEHIPIHAPLVREDRDDASEQSARDADVL